MGPPLSTWPYIDLVPPQKYASDSYKMCSKKCYTYQLIDNFRVLCLNFTFALLFIQVLLSLSSVRAGPVILDMDYSQGPVPLARNIRHLPCISKKTGQEGLCMFAIDCLKANGSHLGTCVDRFYFGSCCQIPEKTILPEIIENNIEDNSIDSEKFLYIHIEDKEPSVIKIPDIYHTKKSTTTTTTEKAETKATDNTGTVQDSTEATELDTKSDEQTTIDNKIVNDEVKFTTATVVDTTPKADNKITEITITETPIKLSTFQTVLSEQSNLGNKKPQADSSNEPVTTTARPKPTRRPIRPTFRPSQKPYNHTSPQYTHPTLKPRPLKPIALYNTTRKPYRPINKRPSTKKPLPIPPRLNITIIPQSTSSRPVFTRPSTVSITYVNTTVSTAETTTTTTPAPSPTPAATPTEAVTEKVIQTTNSVTDASTEVEKSTDKTTITDTTIETVATEATVQITEATEATNQPTVVTTTEVEQVVTEIEAPISPVIATTTTEATKVDVTTPEEVTTKEPERITDSDENYQATTTQAPATQAQTTTEQLEVEPTIQTTTTDAPTSPSSSTTTTTTESPVTTVTQPMIEFTVNVTLYPTIPTSTSSIGLTTFSSVSSANATESADNETGTSTTEALKPTESETTTLEPETTTAGVNMSDYKSVCGRRLWEASTGRIVGGTNSGFGQWPWQISLRQYSTSTYLHQCGAALLNENWAITAAHCLKNVPPSELLVRLGENDLDQNDEPYSFVERRVQIVASHPHFDPDTYEYDLALLRFYEPVTFQPNILPVCVPDNDDDYVGQTAWVTGWGRLYDGGPLPSVLQEVKIPVINNSACEAMYQAAGYNEHIPNIFICAGRQSGRADSCLGDSGGPMVVRRERDNRFVLGGIISWGIGCAEPNQPGVYTRISEFRDWINQILLF